MDLPRFVGVYAEEWKQKMIDGIANNFPNFNKNVHFFHKFEFHYDKRANVKVVKKLFFMDENFNYHANHISIVSVKFAVICDGGDYCCYLSLVKQNGNDTDDNNELTIYNKKLKIVDEGLYDYKPNWFSYSHSKMLIDAKFVYVQHEIKQLQLVTILEFQTNPANYTENTTIVDVERVFADDHIVKTITQY